MLKLHETRIIFACDFHKGSVTTSTTKSGMGKFSSLFPQGSKIKFPENKMLKTNKISQHNSLVLFEMKYEKIHLLACNETNKQNGNHTPSTSGKLRQRGQF